MRIWGGRKEERKSEKERAHDAALKELHAARREQAALNKYNPNPNDGVMQLSSGAELTDLGC